MKPRVYVETSVISYLAAHRSRDLIVAAAASEDALHIAIAAVNGMDFLLTWNCRHIANAMMRARIGAVCERLGYLPPILCTPEELTQP